MEATALSNTILLQDVAFEMNKMYEPSVLINMINRKKNVNIYNQGSKKQSQAHVNKQLNISLKLLS